MKQGLIIIILFASVAASGQTVPYGYFTAHESYIISMNKAKAIAKGLDSSTSKESQKELTTFDLSGSVLTVNVADTVEVYDLFNTDLLDNGKVVKEEQTEFATIKSMFFTKRVDGPPSVIMLKFVEYIDKSYKSYVISIMTAETMRLYVNVERKVKCPILCGCEDKAYRDFVLNPKRLAKMLHNKTIRIEELVCGDISDKQWHNIYAGIDKLGFTCLVCLRWKYWKEKMKHDNQVEICNEHPDLVEEED